MSVLDERLRQPAHEARQRGRSGSGWYAWLARAGLIAKGASFGIVGALAIKLAVGDGGRATSREGALHALAGETFGEVVLILLVIGFVAYALWRFVEAWAAPGEDAKKWAKRVGSLGRGLVYAGLAFSAAKILAGAGGGGSQNQRAHETAATLLSWPGGTWLVGVAGAVVIGVGLWNLYRGLSRKFEDKWRTGEMGPTARRWGGRAGTVGHVARAVVFGLIGIFVIRAALEYDPKQAIGLDGALQKLAGAAYGPYLLGLTAAGLIAYGLYCLVDARYRDVSAD
ncbi:MAG TPA: DUF1206 domain-containing protein [Gaiellaceae bacterium]|nr:DUF1206 domain-containing protein [Gaiellaceae bacterium]